MVSDQSDIIEAITECTFHIPPTRLLESAVWQEVCTLLAHPGRLAEEYRRRLQPETRTKCTPLSTVEGQISKLRQGVARSIDSYAEGLIDKGSLSPE